MKGFYFIAFSSILLLFSSCAQKSEGWVSLMDKDLSQWRIYQSYAFPEQFTGQRPADAEGQTVPPIGYDKNEQNVFSMIEEDGVPVLHISGETYGCVFTKQDYKDYHFRLKTRFGTKRSNPRTDKALDSGILYHSQGEAGVDYWYSWMRSLEFQVMDGGTDEGVSGDFWSVAGTSADIRATKTDKGYFYDPEGELLTFGANGVASQCRAADYTSPTHEWTTMELICYQGKSLYIVNGHVAMALQNLRYRDGEKDIPLTEGKIQLQSEGGEVYYKDAEIKPISGIPAEYAKYFN